MDLDAFVTAIFGNDRTTAPVCVVSYANERGEARKYPPRELYTRNTKDIKAFIAKYDVPGRAVYFCVSTIKEKKRRKKENIAEIVVLQVDLDFKAIQESPDEIDRAIGKLPLTPTFKVFSGHGIHLYWRLATALAGEDGKDVENVLKGIAWLLAGDTSVAETSRVMRLPGTHNSKGGDKIAVEVQAYNDVSYSLEQMEHWIAQAREPLLHSLGKEQAERPKLANGGAADLFMNLGQQQAALSGAERTDIDDLIANMVYRGVGGGGNVHETSVRVIASLISRGEPIDNAVEWWLEQLWDLIPEAQSWDRVKEQREVRGHAITWVVKHPDVLQKQTEPPPEWFVRDSRTKHLLNGGGIEIEHQEQEPAKPKVELKTGKKEEQPPILQGLSYRELHARPVKELEWIVDDFVLAHKLNGMFGDGATGKDLLLLQLGIAMICDAQWLGHDVKQGRVLYFPVEDDEDEIRRRDESISAYYQSLGTYDPRPDDFMIYPMIRAESTIIASYDHRTGLVKPTPLYTTLTRLIESFHPDLVIVSNRVNLFGVGQNDDAQARQCLGLLDKWCTNYGTSVIMPGHPSIYGKSSGEGTSGSVQWNNGVRSRSYLRRCIRKVENESIEDDPTQRELEVMKANYAQQGKRLTLFWRKGVFVEDEVQHTEGSNTNLDVEYEAEFLRMLNQAAAMKEKLSLRDRANNNAGAWMQRQSECRFRGQKHVPPLMAAGRRLLAKGVIILEPYGSPSDDTWKIVRVRDEDYQS